MKTCSKCHKEKGNEEFGKDKYSRNGLLTQCKECRIEYATQYRNSGKYKLVDEKRRKSERRKKYLKEYYSRETVKKIRRDYYREYVKTDNMKMKRAYYMKKRREEPSFRLRSRISSYISAALRGKNGLHVEDFLGCSIEEYMQYLEDRFQEGMTWDNYGKWHVDHIKPVSSFNLNEESQRFDCFHYTNTQPLWAFDNLSKGNKIE